VVVICCHWKSFLKRTVIDCHAVRKQNGYRLFLQRYLFQLIFFPTNILPNCCHSSAKVRGCTQKHYAVSSWVCLQPVEVTDYSNEISAYNRLCPHLSFIVKGLVEVNYIFYFFSIINWINGTAKFGHTCEVHVPVNVVMRYVFHRVVVCPVGDDRLELDGQRYKTFFGVCRRVRVISLNVLPLTSAGKGRGGREVYKLVFCRQLVQSSLVSAIAVCSLKREYNVKTRLS